MRAEDLFSFFHFSKAYPGQGFSSLGRPWIGFLTGERAFFTQLGFSVLSAKVILGALSPFGDFAALTALRLHLDPLDFH